MRRNLLVIATCVLAGCGTDVSGPSSSLYSCVFLDPAALRVGEAIAFQGVGNRSLCLTTSDDGAAFVYVPFYGRARNGGAAEPPLTIGVEVLGAGVSSTSVSGAPPEGPDPVGGLFDPWGPPGEARALAPDVDAHRRLREREQAELGPKILSGAPVDPLPLATSRDVAEPQVGSNVQYNVATSCTAEDMRTGQVTYISDHAIVVADVQNPAGFTAQDYQHFALSFDTLIHPVAVRHFGAPSDVDGNSRTIIFFTRAVNERTPRGSPTFTAALFWAGDLFPAVATPRLEACPAGNQAEIFYVAVPDPNGVIGPAVSLSSLREQGLHILGHEYQHLINAGRRLYVNNAGMFEQVWLNEGLSHIAEELLFFEVSGIPRGANITASLLQQTPGADTAFSRYMDSNMTNLTRFLERADTASLMGPDNLATRGAAWSFLRYAADRRDGGDESFFLGLVNSTAAGVDNLDRVLGESTMDWLQDWTVALIADDHVPGLHARYTQPSWNFRDLFPARRNRAYPLAPTALAAGAPQSLSLQAGGAAFLTFGVAADQRAALHVESGGASPPRTLRGTFLRIR
jgi:hypothetical protein